VPLGCAPVITPAHLASAMSWLSQNGETMNRKPRIILGILILSISISLLIWGLVQCDTRLASRIFHPLRCNCQLQHHFSFSLRLPCESKSFFSPNHFRYCADSGAIWLWRCGAAIGFTGGVYSSCIDAGSISSDDMPLPSPTPEFLIPVTGGDSGEIPERRRLTLEFPARIRAGDSDIVRLTLELDASGNITPNCCS